MSLHRVLADVEALGDLAHRRRRLEGVVRHQRPTELTSTSRCMSVGSRGRLECVGLRPMSLGGVSEHQPGAADEDLLAVTKATSAAQPFAVEPRSIARADHVPATSAPTRSRIACTPETAVSSSAMSADSGSDPIVHVDPVTAIDAVLPSPVPEFDYRHRPLHPCMRSELRAPTSIRIVPQRVTARQLSLACPVDCRLVCRAHDPIQAQ